MLAFREAGRTNWEEVDAAASGALGMDEPPKLL